MCNIRARARVYVVCVLRNVATRLVFIVGIAYTI